MKMRAREVTGATPDLRREKKLLLQRSMSLGQHTHHWASWGNQGNLPPVPQCCTLPTSLHSPGHFPRPGARTNLSCFSPIVPPTCMYSSLLEKIKYNHVCRRQFWEPANSGRSSPVSLLQPRFWSGAEHRFRSMTSLGLNPDSPLSHCVILAP